MASTKGRPTDARHEACALSSYALYGGAVELRFDRQKHVYTVDDEVVPNVTSITGVIAKQGLDGWKFKQALEHLEGRLRPGLDEVAIRRLLDDAAVAADKVTREAGYIGSSTHKWIETHIGYVVEGYVGEYRSAILPEHSAVRAGAEAFLEWEREAKPEYLACERKVMSREHRFVGTLDLLAELDGKRTLIDIKTSNRIYAEHWLQAAAYQIALEEEDGEAVEQRAILHLPKVPGKKAKCHLEVNHEVDKECFLAVRKVYRRIFSR
jgi:CRISPR/Cas system-associated exonuclease Cas4 (RecB family)